MTAGGVPGGASVLGGAILTGLVGEGKEPAFIESLADRMGEFRFGLTSGNIDRPTAQRAWEGRDETNACTGRCVLLPFPRPTRRRFMPAAAAGSSTASASMMRDQP